MQVEGKLLKGDYAAALVDVLREQSGNDYHKVHDLLLIYICNFHVLNHLLLIYICKLHWNPMTTTRWPSSWSRRPGLAWPKDLRKRDCCFIGEAEPLSYERIL